MINQSPALPIEQVGSTAKRRIVIVAANIVSLVAAGLVLGWPWVVRAAQPSNPVAPNVLLIVADDMRADSLWVMSALGRLDSDRGVV